MPLFLELLRDVALRDPVLARKALAGLRRYQSAPSSTPRRERPVFREHEGTTLRSCGGSGPTLILVPSLINPPTILDLDPACSLAGALATRHRVLLLDWGPASRRASLSLDEHVEQRLVPLIEATGQASLIGYCLGGTLAMAAAVRSPAVEAVATLASPYQFSAYGPARHELPRLWDASRMASEHLGFLPMEVLQSAFWQLDPDRMVEKFARFAEMEEKSADAGRFVTLEEWANGGEPLPLPAARQLVEQLFRTGGTLSDVPRCPMLHVTASADRIVPAATAAPGDRVSSPSGHVGMIVGRGAAQSLHLPLLSWLEGAARSR